MSCTCLVGGIVWRSSQASPLRSLPCCCLFAFWFWVGNVRRNYCGVLLPFYQLFQLDEVIKSKSLRIMGTVFFCYLLAGKLPEVMLNVLKVVDFLNVWRFFKFKRNDRSSKF